MVKGKPYVDIRGYHKGVTGSTIRNTVHFSDGKKFRFLIDYGMYQGEGYKGIAYNDTISPEKIDAVIITHTHLDHDGAIPIFTKAGYNKSYYMSEASASLIDIGLEDSYNIMAKEAKFKKSSVLYNHSDLQRALTQVKGVKYRKPIKIHDNITVTFFENGHLIGSSIVLIQIEEIAGTVNLLYTGDYKPYNTFLDIFPLPSWVYALQNLTIITESTYGSTNSSDIKQIWEDDIIEACHNNTTVLNTAFGQGRFLEFLYYIRKLQDEKEIPKNLPVKVDGSTGIDYTFRYISMRNVLGIKPEIEYFLPYNIQFVDSKSRPAILQNKDGKIIISTSGMGSHGPASTYIPHFLSDPNALIYFPGYTSEGSLGRKVLEAEYGEKVDFTNSQSVTKRARVLQTFEFSSHAKADELIYFINKFAPYSVLINHGDPEVKSIFEERVKRETGVRKTGVLGMGYVYRVNCYGIDKAVEK